MEFTLSSTAARVSSALSSIYNSFLGQTRSQAQLHAITSYDQSNEFFKVCLITDTKRNFADPFSIKAFLSKKMMSSCALWSEAEGGVRGDLEIGPGDLEAAQIRKINSQNSFTIFIGCTPLWLQSGCLDAVY